MLDLKNSYRWVMNDEKNGEQSSNTKKKVEEEQAARQLFIVSGERENYEKKLKAIFFYIQPNI